MGIVDTDIDGPRGNLIFFIDRARSTKTFIPQIKN